MKRCLFKLVVFLLLGAIVNVAVAWGCAYWIDPSSPVEERMEGFSHQPPEYEYWRTQRMETIGALRIVSSWLPRESGVTNIFTGFIHADAPTSESLVPSWADYLHPLHGEPDRGRYNWVADARGWPLFSMWGGCRSRTVFSSSAQRGESEAHPFRAIRFSRRDEPSEWNDYLSTLLPLAPLWPGFGINTVFYASILWLFMLGPFTARRMIRRKRGHCIKCGYDLRGAEHEVCPECGVEVS